MTALLLDLPFSAFDLGVGLIVTFALVGLTSPGETLLPVRERPLRAISRRSRKHEPVRR